MVVEDERLAERLVEAGYGLRTGRLINTLKQHGSLMCTVVIVASEAFLEKISIRKNVSISVTCIVTIPQLQINYLSA